ncbi:hypothetical protein MKW98_009429 [Papaver atlanticum]|uniref:Exostosin GT47 domain-containing protein n=1 Tax=Papaver atlanticum TaxID=357466 RepID=A0AAD4SHM0_9MAGN|nr:hypothetical protein MKW98_009429 [Papaver atlanticum]
MATFFNSPFCCILFSTLLFLHIFFLYSLSEYQNYIITYSSLFSLDYHNINDQNHSLDLKNAQISHSSSPTYGFLSNTSNITNGTSINGTGSSSLITTISTTNNYPDNHHGRDNKQNKKRSLKILEEGLARARAAIIQATRTHVLNHNTSGKEDFKFISKRSIYRNQDAFYQSHIEMEKRFKVWTYKEGDLPLVHEGPLNNIYSTEGQFIDEMESGASRFSAQHPDQAHVFFLPFSVARLRRFVFKPEPSLPQDRLNWFVTDYIRVISSRYPFWNRSAGADHFMVSCHDWGPNISIGRPELFKNFIRVLCNANTSEGFLPERDVSLPEVKLPFGQLTLPKLGVPPSERSILAFFAGRVHGRIRKVLMKHWKDKDDEVQVYEYLPKSQSYAKKMGQSKFCLCPSGWEVASPRVVESIFAGCIPVIMSTSYLLPFSDVLDWSQFSVTIPVQKIPMIKDLLKSISVSEYTKIHRRLKQVQRHFTVNRPSKRFDLIRMVLHSVWLRRLNVGLIS